MTERGFGAQLLSLLPSVVDGVEQKLDQNHFASIVVVDNIKIKIVVTCGAMDMIFQI